MTSVANRRSMMGLYSGNTCIRSHQVRIVLAEKGILTEINNIDGSVVPEDLMALNPYVSLPTLIDRELVLYDSRVIVEYLDEQTQNINSTIEKETQRIKLLKEYRQSLISEVVTGKVKVVD